MKIFPSPPNRGEHKVSFYSEGVLSIFKDRSHAIWLGKVCSRAANDGAYTVLHHEFVGYTSCKRSKYFRVFGCIYLPVNAHQQVWQTPCYRLRMIRDMQHLADVLLAKHRPFRVINCNKKTASIDKYIENSACWSWPKITRSSEFTQEFHVPITWHS